jgi:CzcA family heavy metal efflux pump
VKVLDLLRRHASVVWLATAVLVALGVASAYSMPSAIYPEVEFPRIIVVARTGGAPPDVYLMTVTRPLEQTLTTVLGVQRIRSKTIRGATEISLQFAPDTDMWRALQMVESRVNEVRSSLPPGAEIIVERVTTGSFPVVTFNVSGAADPRELRELAEFVVRPALANISGVGRIEVLGGDVREVEVILDPEATSSLHLTPADVAGKLQTAMGLAAIGRVDRDRQLVTVIGDAQPKKIADIREMPVATMANGGVVPLQSIAEVIDGAQDRTVRIGGPLGETVGLSVARLPGASTPDVVNRALAAVDALRPSLPQGVTIRPVYDQASLVQESMASVRDAILLGIALCAGVIAVFLRDMRAGLLAALTVPVTLAISFGTMRLASQTLNLMSLGGMAVAIGLVVDDAIVMVEAIARHRDAGEPPATAAAKGTAELAPAVIGTTMTTVVVFVPLAFLQGIVGDFFRALAFTVTSAVLVSLAVALVLVPLAASLGLSSQPNAHASTLLSRYERVVRRFVRYPFIAAVVFAVFVGGGSLVAPYVSRGFLPTMDEGAFVLDYFLPAGTSLDTTQGFARRLEDELRKTPEVRAFTRRTGAELGPAAATQLNRGDIMVRLLPASERERSSEAIIADLRERIQSEMPEVRIEFVQVLQDVLNDLSGSPRPIEVKLFGPDYDRLHEIGDKLAADIKDVKGLVDLYDGHERDAPELRFTARRDSIARFGTTPDDVSAQIDTALRGAIVGSIRRYDRLVGVRVRYPNPVRFDSSHVLDLPFATRDRTTTFRAVSDIETTASPSLLMHEALQPMVDITGDHQGRDLGSVADDVEAAVKRLRMPPGYRAVLGGQIEGQKATVHQLAAVGGIAVLLVLTVLAAQFRRMRVAALVLASVPIAIVGAIVALFITSTPVNASSLMGCVLLVGLVVKNGVLLLEEAEKLVDRGEDAVDAVAHASERRLRPVAMTTIATLAGLFPLALGIGSGAELQRPLAIAVIGGLVTSTVATLGLLPPFAALALRSRLHAT